jgi:hypothetical protein
MWGGLVVATSAHEGDVDGYDDNDDDDERGDLVGFSCSHRGPLRRL